MFSSNFLLKKVAINELILVLSIVLLLSHVLRNLTTLYLLILFSFLIFSLLYAVKKLGNVASSHLFFFYTLFIFITLYVAIISLIYSGFDALFSLPRLLLMPVSALIFFCLYNINKLLYGKLLLFVYLVFIIIGSLSMILQIYIGPIGWFADYGSPRGGFERFSSFLGSLTIFGTSVQFGILIALMFIRGLFYKLLVIFVLLIGSAMSLQKAAFVNVMLVFLIYFLVLNRLSFSRVAAGAFFLCMLTSIFILLNFLYPGNFVASYIDVLLVNTLGFQLFTEHVIAIDDGLTSDRIIERFGILALDIFELHDPLIASVFGIGVIGAGSGMGISGPQAHNTLLDILFMGGFIYLGSFLFLFKYLFLLMNRNTDQISKFYCLALILFAVNLPFTSSFIYHPVTSFIFWSSVGYALSCNFRFNIQK